LKLPAVLAVLASTGGLAGCVNVQWARADRDLPVDRRAFESLEPGHDDLSTCLERLGAPLYVLEQADGAALAFGWTHSRTRGLGVSVPVYRSASASVDLEKVDKELEGVVLFFDGDWILRLARRGKLAEIVRRPPALLEAP